jgi:hypothetical protein
VDVGIILWIYVFQFWMESFVSGARETCIAFWNLGEGITLMKVGVIVISRQP